MSIEDSSNLFAAIDLGSNSFHLIIARLKNGQLQVIDKIKEMVRLASGIDKRGFLADDKAEEALLCLSRFAQRLLDLPSQNVRIVGTNTLRKAKNSADFIHRAEKVLNHPIEVIAGREEARLIYLGVAHGQAENEQKNLVMDIGGGSTEFIIGRSFEPILTESLHMGCVSMTLQAFKNGKLNEKNFARAILAAELELRVIRNEYLKYGWNLSIGASGTIKAIGQVLSIQFAQSYRGITPEGLMWLKQMLIGQKRIDKITLEGLSADRAPVFAGGVAIMIATFKILHIELMMVSDSALREGLVYDMLGRRSHEDVRSRTIDYLLQQYHVSSDQSDRVATSSLTFYNLLKQHWSIEEEECLQSLIWAAKLHEIGLSIAHNQYHKHGAYIISHADMPGFSKAEQKRLAILIRAQRGKIPINDLNEFNAHYYQRIIYQIILLRLSVLFNRGRSDKKIPPIRVESRENYLKLIFPENYFIEKPLTYADLKKEKKTLKVIDFQLELDSEKPE